MERPELTVRPGDATPLEMFEHTASLLGERPLLHSHTAPISAERGVGAAKRAMLPAMPRPRKTAKIPDCSWRRNATRERRAMQKRVSGAMSRGNGRGFRDGR